MADQHAPAPLPRSAGAAEPVERPWGSYVDLQRGDRYLVKRLLIRSGRRLSLQRHHHRCEHWVVVGGRGVVRLGDRTLTVGRGDRLTIPLGTIHRAEALVGADLEIIEVQLGDVLREDDIVRLEDDYGRLAGPLP